MENKYLNSSIYLRGFIGFFKKENITLLLLLLSLNAGAAQLLSYPFEIIPKLQEVIIFENESGIRPESLQKILLIGFEQAPILGCNLSQLNHTNTDGKGTVRLVRDIDNDLIPNDEGYILTLSNDEVELIAKTEAGLFYGSQTLEQLIESAKDHQKAIPACKIIDYPKMRYRAVHFDVKHHLDHIKRYYEIIDKLAKYKINAIIFEFEDKLQFRTHPKVGSPQAISMDEMKNLTNYARERYIEITPKVQGLGHVNYILKHPEYIHLREIPWNHYAFCPLHEGTYQVVFDLFRDAMEATPGSKYFHIGGDEVGQMMGVCPRCTQFVEKEGKTALYLYWLNRACEFIVDNGRTPIFWDDMLFHTVDLLGTIFYDKPAEEVAEKWEVGLPKLNDLLDKFPKNAYYMRWNYSLARQDGNVRALDWYKEKEMNVMIATAGRPESIRSYIQLAGEKDIDKMLCCAWDDNSPHMELHIRNYIASAEYSWNPTGRTVNEYTNAWLEREFNVQFGEYQEFQQKVREAYDFWNRYYYKNRYRTGDDNALQGLIRLEHWLPLVEGMEKMNFDYRTKLIDLPDIKKPGEWTKRYQDRIEIAKRLNSEYDSISETINQYYKLSKRNNYFWGITRVLYNLHSTAPRLYLALEQCDTKNKKQREEGISNLESVMQDFHIAWENLKSEYAKTRFIAYPDNYVPDRFFHLASQREDLSWMIQCEEIYFKMIDEWIAELN